MKLYLRFICLGLSSFLIYFVSAQTLQPYGFIENRGQIRDQNGQISAAHYVYTAKPGLNVQIHSTGFSYDAYQVISDSTVRDSFTKQLKSRTYDLAFHRVDVDFPGCNPSVQREGMDCAEDYLMYFHDAQTEGTSVRHLRKILFKNLYPFIDLEMLADPGSDKTFEYNFILHPGADLRQIRMRYRGALACHFSAEKLQLELSMGTIEERIPASFWAKSGEKLEIQYRLISHTNEEIQVGFDGHAGIIAETLIIDPIPSLNWSTYVGSGAYDYGREVIWDGKGHLYWCGSIGVINNLATAGVHQSVHGGTTDALLAKFTTAGKRVWASFLGGSGEDYGQSLQFDADGNLLFAGLTNSDTGIAAPIVADQGMSRAGSHDVFLAKFTSSGNRIWSRYWGGPAYDWVSDISPTTNGDFLICGNTYSETGIASEGQLDTDYSGLWDGFLARFNTNGSFQAATYLGGSSDDSVQSLHADEQGTIYLVGSTGSSDGLIPVNAYQERKLGMSDATLWKLDPSFNIIWSTYLGGQGDDSGFSLALDAEKNIYFTGRASSADYPQGSKTGQSALKGTGDAHLTKFSKDGQLLWSTFFGGTGNELGYAIKLDPLGSGAIFVTGSTNASPDFTDAKAWQSNYGGGLLDGFLVKLDAEGQLIWSTYYGGANDEQLTGIDLDQSGNIYCIGFTDSSSGLISEGAFQALHGGSADILLASFKDCYTPFPPQNISTPAQLRICEGSRTTLLVKGEGMIEWYDRPQGGRLLGRGDQLLTAVLRTNTTFYVQDSICGRSARTAINVQVDPRPQLDPGAPQQVCAGSQLILTASGALFYRWNNRVTNGVPFKPDSTRVYTVIGTGTTGCRDTAQVLVTVLPQPQVSAGGNRELCSGAPLILKGSGADTYTWDQGVIDGQTFVPLRAGTYTLIGRNRAGCADTAMINLTLLPSPRINVNSFREVCANDTLSLNASGADNLVWDNGIQNGVAFQARESRTYTVIGIDSNQCRDTAQVQVRVKPKPVVEGGPDIQICDGDPILFQGTGADILYWSRGVINGVPFIPKEGGPYYLYGINNEGCTDTDEIILTLYPKPVIMVGPDQRICAGEAVRLSAEGASLHQWDFGVDNGIAFQPDSTRTYTVTGIDTNSCQNTAEVTVTVLPKPQVTAGADREICSGEAITLEGRGAIFYTWSPTVQNGIPFVPDRSQIYVLIGADENNCRDTTEIQVLVHPKPVVDAGANQSICAGTPLVLQGQGATFYDWDQGVLNGQSFIPSKTQVYTVIGRNEHNCRDTAQLEVKVNTLPILNLPAEVSVCKAESITIAPKVQEGTAPLQFLWSNGFRDSILTIQSFENTTLNLMVLDSFRCQASGQLTIKVNDRPQLNIEGPDYLCVGETARLNTRISAGTEPYSYVWSTGESEQGIWVKPLQSSDYALFVQDKNHCKDTAYFAVRVVPRPRVSFDQPTLAKICEGQEFKIKASGGLSYDWTGPGNFRQNTAQIELKIPVAGSYVLELQDALGCKAKDSIILQLLLRPSARIAGPRQICEGEQLVLQGSGGQNYYWSTGATGARLELKPGNTQRYELIVQDANACRDTTTTEVLVQNYPQIQLPYQHKLSLGGTLQLSSSGIAETYQWSPGEGLGCTDCPNPNLNGITQNTRYCLLASNADCQVELCTEVIVGGKCQVFMPDAFSPNGDQINDAYCVYSPCLKQAQLWIYDRWGALVFQNKDNGNEWCWDGQLRGSPAAIGTYYYVLRGTDVLGQTVDFRGALNLLR